MTIVHHRDTRLMASRVVLVIGVLLLVVAGIHLAVTPLLKEAVLDRVLEPKMMSAVGPPFLLNHLVVGFLLVPLGMITVFCSGGIRRGERWAWVIAFTIGVALLSLPVLLAIVMRGGRFDAAPFRVAEALITVCAVTMPAVLLWVRPRFFRKIDDDA